MTLIGDSAWVPLSSRYVVRIIGDSWVGTSCPLSGATERIKSRVKLPWRIRHPPRETCRWQVRCLHHQSKPLPDEGNESAATLAPLVWGSSGPERRAPSRGRGYAGAEEDRGLTHVVDVESMRFF